MPFAPVTCQALPLVTLNGGCDHEGLPLVPDPGTLALEHKAASQELYDDAEDLCCFITFVGPKDGTLGLGLYTHPRTPQQRGAKLPPDFDIVGDYLEAEAFNDGLRHALSANNSQSSSGPYQEPPSLVSSARRRINSWLPLYINAQHWAEARRYMPNAIEQLRTPWFQHRLCATEEETCTAGARAEDALEVCCSLLTCAVVGFTAGQSERASPRAAGRGKATERAVQTYADVHRLLLELAKENPAVRRLALARLRGFISDPAMRTLEATPNLGTLVHSLLIVDEVTWEDLAPSLLPEALRRHAVRQRSRGWTFNPRSCSGSTEQLISAWEAFAQQPGLVISFCAMFYKRVGRPQGCTLREVEISYDRRCGRLRDDVKLDIVSACAQLAECHSLTHVLDIILPSSSSASRVDDAGELILWADRYGRRRDALAIPAEAWPSLDGKCPLLHQRLALTNKRGQARKSWNGWERRATRRKRAWQWDQRDAEVRSVGRAHR